MEEPINFQIRNFGPIKEANLKIGKINIIGGHNATGKSSASKLLYCFLKAGCNKRQDFAYESITSSLNSLTRKLKPDIQERYKLRNIDFSELLDEYEQIKEKYFLSEDQQNKFINEEIAIMDDFLDEIQENNDLFYLSMLRNLLKIEFKNNTFNGEISFSNKMDKNLISLSSLLSHSFNSFQKIKPNCYLDIYDVFYMDSVSILDRNNSRFRLRRINYYDHVDYLSLILKENEDTLGDMLEDRNNLIKSVEEKVKQIINGQIEFNNNKFTYYSKNSEPFNMENTASGIKQIGIVQLLLFNYKLKKDSFLIIDEPEVNLHPEWQIKFAEILVLLSKELNITIYINTHSPMFIEAMSLYSEYYDLLDDTFIYLTEKYYEGFKFKQISSKDMGAVYENLSRPYDDLDDIKSKIIFEK